MLYFCYNCMKSYNQKSNDDNHNCGCNVKKKKINYKNNSKLLRDLPHYLKKNLYKGQPRRNIIFEKMF